MSKYIDIHCHVNFSAFEADREEVIKRALENDTWMINVGTQADTSRKAVELAEKYGEGVYAAVGLHPIHTSASYHDEKELGEGGKEFTSRGEVFDKNVYREILKSPKAVAIGECGLDYYRTDPGLIEKQAKSFIEQIELANETGKALMLHIRNDYEKKDRNAYKDTLDILEKYAKVKGVVHFFEGDIEDALNFVSLGFMVSFTGVITYPLRKTGRNCDYEKILKEIPLDMILTDTDSPYLAPAPYRGKRNEPVYVREVVKRIAQIKNLPEENVARGILANAKKIFQI